MSKQQLHKRFSTEQVKTILESYLAKELSVEEAQEKLEISRSQFFEITGKYRKDPKEFDLNYHRAKPTRSIGTKAEKSIIRELKEEKKLIDNKDNTVKNYNYSYIQDNLRESNCLVSLPTIIARAKDNGFYLPRKKKKKNHDREVVTNFIGETVQHDSSHHQFSPYIAEKLYLITSLDDYSRCLLFADIFTRETSWLHIMAAQRVILQYGCPLKYYVDQHAVFRYVKGRDKNSPWKTFHKFTDDVDPQFKQVLADCNVGITYALSPQAKGKIERPYRWLQDRLVRIAAREKIKTIEELRLVLNELVAKYNTQWVHSTTKEIPIVRFEKALNNQDCLFKPLKITNPDSDIKDIFCLRAQRVIDAYRRVSIDGLEIKVPQGEPRRKVDLHIVPDIKQNLAEIRFWQQSKYLGSQNVKLSDLKIVRF
ncbi:MAG: hypothetical protein ABII72_01520 [Parcubacteria group bacterium]